MSEPRSYIAAAFNARPFGMKLAPNWFGLAAFGLLGAFVNPGFWLIGAGLEALYLWVLAQNPRFRAALDAASPGATNWNARYQTLIDPLDADARSVQSSIEQQAAEIVRLLARVGANESQIGDVRQMAWLHLKLLAARASLVQVLQLAGNEKRSMDEQEQRIAERLKRGDADDELRRSLEQQVTVIQSRRTAHADAQRRQELVDAELDRLRQQISLVREQALLATDEHSVAQSLDSLSASLNEANRWLKDQRELFAGLDDLTDEAPPAELLRPKQTESRRQKVAE
jgi:hypothetical protein